MFICLFQSSALQQCISKNAVQVNNSEVKNTDYVLHKAPFSERDVSGAGEHFVSKLRKRAA